MVYSLFVLDSSTADNPNAPTFTIARNPYVAKFKVVSCHLPSSFRTTGNHNNRIAIRENGVVRTVTIPPGDYSSATMPAAIKSALGGDYNVTYDETNRNIKITNPNVSFSILGLQGGTTAFAQLGNGRDMESNAGNTFQGNAVSNFTGPSSLLLVCNELLTRDMVLLNNQSLNAIALVDLTAPQGSYVHWKNSASFLDSGVSVGYCTFRFLDPQTLNQIDFRGLNFTIQLAVCSDDDDVTMIM